MDESGMKVCGLDNRRGGNEGGNDAIESVWPTKRLSWPIVVVVYRAKPEEVQL